MRIGAVMVSVVVKRYDEGAPEEEKDEGRQVSPVEEDLGGKKPGEAESFQWINLMRGDTSFMSLVNHHYLTTKPNEPGPLTATAAGPSAARKDGACFKWKVVD